MKFKKKDKKEKKRPEKNKFKGKKPFDKTKKFEKKEVFTERKPQKMKKQQEGPTIKSYKQPELETSEKPLSYSQIASEKPKIKKREEEKIEQVLEREEEQVLEEEEEVENLDYDDFNEDTVILPDSTKEFFIDEVQFGSLNITSNDTKEKTRTFLGISKFTTRYKKEDKESTKSTTILSTKCLFLSVHDSTKCSIPK